MALCTLSLQLALVLCYSLLALSLLFHLPCLPSISIPRPLTTLPLHTSILLSTHIFLFISLLAAFFLSLFLCLSLSLTLTPMSSPTTSLPFFCYPFTLFNLGVFTLFSLQPAWFIVAGCPTHPVLHWSASPYNSTSP